MDNKTWEQKHHFNLQPVSNTLPPNQNMYWDNLIASQLSYLRREGQGLKESRNTFDNILHFLHTQSYRKQNSSMITQSYDWLRFSGTDPKRSV